MNRRAWIVALALLGWAGVSRGEDAHPVERWGIFELAMPGPSTGNPFVEVEFAARFTQGDRSIDVPGFYIGLLESGMRHTGAREPVATVTNADGVECTFVIEWK